MMIFFNKRKTLRRCQLPVCQQPGEIAEVQLQTVSVVDHEDNILSRWCEATGRGVPRGEKVGARFALDRQQNLTNSRRCLTLAEDVPQRGLRHSVAAHHTEGCLFQKRKAYVAGNCQREKGCLSLSWNWNKCPLSALRFTQERHWDLLSTHRWRRKGSTETVGCLSQAHTAVRVRETIKTQLSLTPRILECLQDN